MKTSRNGSRDSQTESFVQGHWTAMHCSLFSYVQLFATLWSAAHQAFLSFTISRNLLKLIPTGSVIPPNHLILCCPILLLPSILPSIWTVISQSKTKKHILERGNFLSNSWNEKLSIASNTKDRFIAYWKNHEYKKKKMKIQVKEP